MNGEQLAKEMSEAEHLLAHATARLRAARAAALMGEPYETTLLDQLVTEYCQAMRAVEGASLAWEQWQHGRADASAAAVGASPAPPTPALRFARWLYERGLIAG